jgi:hypothetical protein
MATKHTESTANRLGNALENHAQTAHKAGLRITSTQPSYMSFLSWIDPPIGVDMSAVDTVHPQYKVSIMTVGSSSGGPVLVLPFAEPIAWYPMAAPTIRLQYSLSSTLPNDPTGADFYETMTVSQVSPGVLTIRSRVFLTPSKTAFTGVTTSTATVSSPAIIQVNGVVNSFNQQVTVFYEHFLPSDAYGPTDLFLQQPW